MTDQPETDAGSQRGRYAFVPQPDGALTIARSIGLCDACSVCDCGEQAEQVTIPAHLMPMVRKAFAGKLRLPGLVKMARRGGG